MVRWTLLCIPKDKNTLTIQFQIRIMYNVGHEFYGKTSCFVTLECGSRHTLLPRNNTYDLSLTYFLCVV